MNTPYDPWMDQPSTVARPSFDDLRRRRDELDRRTRRRNAVELIAGGAASVFLLVMCALSLARVDDPADLVRALGFAALPLGLLVSAAYVFFNRRRAEQDMARTGLDHLVRGLRREHRLLRLAWFWYVGPMIPGFVMIYVGTYLAQPEMWAFAAIAGGLTALFLIWVATINLSAARRVGDEIQRLEQLEGAGR